MHRVRLRILFRIRSGTVGWKDSLEGVEQSENSGAEDDDVLRNLSAGIWYWLATSRDTDAWKHTHTHTHTLLTALCPGLHRWAGTRKVKPISILLEQETVSGSGISWAICKSAPRSRQKTTPVPHHSSFFTGRMPFLPPNQQCQNTEG